MRLRYLAKVAYKSIYHTDPDKRKLTYKGKSVSFAITEQHMLNIKTVMMKSLQPFEEFLLTGPKSWDTVKLKQNVRIC